MGSKVDYYSEHIDATRLPEAQYKTAFGDYLRLKYRSSRFDAVIATHQLAFDFLTSDRKELFPDAPIVFLTEDRTARQIPNSAGVVVGCSIAYKRSAGACMHCRTGYIRRSFDS
jgi:hypothetical protein